MANVICAKSSLLVLQPFEAGIRGAGLDNRPGETAGDGQGRACDMHGHVGSAGRHRGRHAGGGGHRNQLGRYHQKLRGFPVEDHSQVSRQPQPSTSSHSIVSGLGKLLLKRNLDMITVTFG